MVRDDRLGRVGASALTYGNLVAGSVSVFGSMRGQRMRPAALIMIGGMCDGLDGAWARRAGGESDFGVAIDALADVISFGLAPACLLLNYAPAGGPSRVRGTPVLYVAATASRLARHQTSPTVQGEFVGLPASVAGILLAFGSMTGVKRKIMMRASGVLSFLMISRLRVPSIGTFRARARNRGSC